MFHPGAFSLWIQILGNNANCSFGSWIKFSDNSHNIFYSIVRTYPGPDMNQGKAESQILIECGMSSMDPFLALSYLFLASKVSDNNIPLSGSLTSGVC
mmetsp:Transcript_3904/g.4369  ORF Transcript_3904/g.4369 Transcript_3904/m.4369 type:complete len:98 (+) Transcript_3904:2587-2880(+)